MDIFFKPKIKINNIKYAIIEKIGEGGFALVYKVKEGKNVFALKKVICQTNEQVSEANKEINFLKLLSHKNIVKLLGHEAVTTPNKNSVEIYLLLPFYQISIQGFIDNNSSYPNSAFNKNSDAIKSIISDVTEGLSAIHQLNFRHSDFKAANILLDHTLSHAVITDFGSLCQLTTKVSNRSMALCIQENAAIHTTASYRAPELFITPNDCTIDGKVDIWGFGCILYQMLFSKTPFESLKDGISVSCIQSGSFFYPFNHLWNAKYVDLINNCLKVNTTERYDISEVKKHVKLLNQNSNIYSSTDSDSSLNDSLSRSSIGYSPSTSQSHDPTVLRTFSTSIEQSNLSLKNPEISIKLNERRISSQDAEHVEFNDVESVLNSISPSVKGRVRFNSSANTEIESSLNSSKWSEEPNQNYSKVSGLMSNSLDYNQNISSRGVLKSFFVTVLRPRGITRNLTIKTVCILLTKRYIIIQKSIDYTSKIHAVISLSQNVTLINSLSSMLFADSHATSISLNPNDSSPLGIFQLTISGMFKESQSNGDSADAPLPKNPDSPRVIASKGLERSSSSPYMKRKGLVVGNSNQKGQGFLSTQLAKSFYRNNQNGPSYEHNMSFNMNLEHHNDGDYSWYEDSVNIGFSNSMMMNEFKEVVNELIQACRNEDIDSDDDDL